MALRRIHTDQEPALHKVLRQFAKDRRNRGVSAFADVNGYN